MWSSLLRAVLASAIGFALSDCKIPEAAQVTYTQPGHFQLGGIFSFEFTGHYCMWNCTNINNSATDRSNGLRCRCC